MMDDDETNDSDGVTAGESQALMRFGPEMNHGPGHSFDDTSGILFEQAMAQTRMAICLADPHTKDMPIVFVNNAFVRLTGYEAHEVLGKNCRFLQGPRTDREQVRRIAAALAAEDVVVVELLNYRKDGTSFWNALHLGPIYDPQGRLLYYFGSQWNVSDVRVARAEEQHARTMARELSHRMKNMFAVIGGLVTVTGRTRNIRVEAAEINDRIRALGRAFETTLDDANRGTVELGPAVTAVLDAYDPENNRIRYQGDSIRVDPNVISTVGLVLHEMATNALKHGALSVDDGRVNLDWSPAEDGGVVFAWHERGGPRVAPPAPEGEGSGIGIIDALLTTIGGSLTYDWKSDGLQVSIHIPRLTREP